MFLRGSVSNPVRIGKDGVLSKIDALMDLVVVCADMQACAGVFRDRAPGGMIRWSASTVCCSGSGPPKLARALNCGWISCCFAAPGSLCLSPMRRPVAVFAIHDDLLTGVCRWIGDHGPKRWNVPLNADTQARWVRNGPKPRQGYKMTSNGFARPDEEGFIDSIYTGAPANRAGNPEKDLCVSA